MLPWELVFFLLFGLFIISSMLALVLDMHVRVQKWREK